MYLKLSFCCLKVVCAGIYFDLKNLGVLPSYCVSAKVVLPYLKPHIYAKHFCRNIFSPVFFLVCRPSFCPCAKRPIKSLNNLTFETRKTVLPKQVFVIQRGKGEYEDFLSFIIRLNQRQSPSAPLVSKEIETDFFRRRFSRSREKFPKLRTLV